MRPKRSRRRVDPDLVLLHWTIALLFVIAVTGILGRGLLVSGDALRPALRALHIVTGQLILVFGVVRLLVRLRSRMPGPVPASLWVRGAQYAVHGALYLVMFVQPVTGILFMQAGDKQVPFFNWTLPQVMPSDKALHFELKDAHQFIGYAFFALIAMHVAAALWHHYVLRDDRLRRMLERRRQARSTLMGGESSYSTLSADSALSTLAELPAAPHAASPQAAPPPEPAPPPAATLTRTP